MRSDIAMSGYIRIRVFSEEKRSLKEIARDHGLSLSEFIRLRALNGSELGSAVHGNS